ncbi:MULTISPECIES: zinc ribbon domain-containing protein [Microbacterium]|uniref:DNA-binding protein n=1 Tax=Microbacterium aurugineum TaxID=2851642 RepID=A0ABY4IY15_9MICO|nr:MULTISPECIES: C4-type zinc ribbon domain-containing protein [Microbacterium]PKQ35044.1 MAG: DNA-binding protein [Actinobacteria bacterium HGW-Actinobacteria-11]MCE0507711.1 C4-type zinc ribbon domain-containing protein [Microbacterium sp. KKR3/1]MCK8465887.1 C4-type zinc ribbon domain-containing protein [Microbacterium aurugineum]MCK8477713.1 C4-type zinc ribbon domain-containing protein [Microbacterium aurugineum]MCZ4300925.1 C4-type zinc ribbon domain-containing protein [Microbacterium ox
MNASPENQRTLLDIADLDRRIAQAERARTKPSQAGRITELVAIRQEQLRELTALTGARDDVRTELTRLESDVAVVAARRNRDAERLATATNPKDAQALEHELASLAKRQSDLEDAQLDVMGRLEEAEASVAAQQALLETTTAEGTSLTAQAKADVAAATDLGSQLARDRAAVAESVPPQLLAEYSRRAANSAGAALLTRGTCEGCRILLPSTDLNDIRRAADDLVVSCPECGCILVRTEESGLA